MENVITKKGLKTRNAGLHEKQHEPRYTGLCVNCDNREDCKIRNNDFVIWHCEEYQ
jgi:hypothetical protein